MGKHAITGLECGAELIGIVLMPDESQDRVIAIFAHERGDARVRKRIAALQIHGWKVAGFTFHRPRKKAEDPVFWENIELGTTYNRRYGQRIGALVAALLVIWRSREKLRECRVFYAINLDNALLALAGRILSRGKMPVVLEMADVQAAMMGNSLRAKLLRWLERIVLRRVVLLVITSPGFILNYFRPVQGYEGSTFLLENKLFPSSGMGEGRNNPAPAKRGAPWVVGCFGAFRCEKSLRMMKELCRRLPGKVEFVLHGYPAGTLAQQFEELIAGEDGIKFGGAYRYPDDLWKMYDEVDLNWVFDESDPNGNSAWLLPNRIYEGGCFEVPALGTAGTETGQWIERQQAGWTIKNFDAATLERFFRELAVEEWASIREHCHAIDRDAVRGERDYQEWSTALARL